MTYKDYDERSTRLMIMQEALEKQFCKEYTHRDLIGKIVNIKYRFRGKTLKTTVYFEKLAVSGHDICPIFRLLRKGKRTRMILYDIYSLKQIAEIEEYKEN